MEDKLPFIFCCRQTKRMLQALSLGGERVLLLHPPDVDYVAALLGSCAGTAAVPAYPPRK